jgi:hypothetical protein
VRDHLGRISLRSVERCLHSLPGADNGAAGAIAGVKETGALYPVITPQLHPRPAGTSRRCGAQRAVERELVAADTTRESGLVLQPLPSAGFAAMPQAIAPYGEDRRNGDR